MAAEELACEMQPGALARGDRKAARMPLDVGGEFGRSA